MQKLIVTGGNPLRGVVEVSGSKNATLPLMAAALLGFTATTLRNVPDLRDIRTMAGVLSGLGARVDFDIPARTMVIDPAGFTNTEAPYDMVRKMRASIYVMGPMLARLRKARVSMPGGCAIGTRPVDLHLKGFEALGVKIGLESGDIMAETPGLAGAEFNLSGAAGSSVGATCNVAMAATLASGVTTIHGAAQEPDVTVLLDFLNLMGARIEGIGQRTLVIHGVESLRGIDHPVVADRIEAGTFMTAAAITGGDVTLTGAPIPHMEATIDKLHEIGVGVTQTDAGLRVFGDPAGYRPANIQTWTYPGFATDMQAQFMALLCIVPGESVIKETIYPDRFIHAMELIRMGADIRMGVGQATVHGVARLQGAPVMASDLRASAALVVAALAAEGTTHISRVYHIDRGYEAIERKIAALGGVIERVGDPPPDDAPAPADS